MAAVQVDQEQAVGAQAAQVAQALMFLLQEPQSPTPAGAGELVMEHLAAQAVSAGAEQQVAQVQVAHGVLAVPVLLIQAVVVAEGRATLVMGLQEQALVEVVVLA